MLSSPIALEKAGNLEHLPLDDYRVSASLLTENVKSHLLEDPSLPGFLIMENDQVLGSITRRAFFEKLSSDISIALYARRPIGILLDNMDEDVLKIAATTSITDAVRLSFCRPTKSVYDPIVVVKQGREAGMLDFSKLILAQSEMFSTLNSRLIAQEQELRNYAEQAEEQSRQVRKYAEQLEEQQDELQERNHLLEAQKSQLEEQKAQLQLKTQELSLKTEEITSLNRRFEEVGSLLSREGQKTFLSLSQGVESVIKFTQNINRITQDFREKLANIDQGNDLINKISKRVENLSFQASIISTSLPVSDDNRLPFNMIIEEIEKLSIQIAEANTTINDISKELRDQIRALVKTAEDNQEVVTNLSRNSQKTEAALASLSQLLA
jgi:DNA repair exonuclease SbcCD ATPase subunit